MDEPHIEVTYRFLAVSLDYFINRPSVAVDFGATRSEVITCDFKVLEAMVCHVVDLEVASHDHSVRRPCVVKFDGVYYCLLLGLRIGRGRRSRGGRRRGSAAAVHTSSSQETENTKTENRQTVLQPMR